MYFFSAVPHLPSHGLPLLSLTTYLWICQWLLQVIGARVEEAIGTEGFRAPEVEKYQWDSYDAIAASPKHDIYSLGCTLNWLLEKNPLE